MGKYRLFKAIAMAALLVAAWITAELFEEGSDFFGQAVENEAEARTSSQERIAVSGNNWVIKGPKDGYLEVIESSGGRKYKGDLLPVVKGDGVAMANQLSLHDYLLGVIPYEMPASWQEEALKAQAVAARTYVHGRNYRVVDSDADQVYRGIYESAYAPRVLDAVTKTNGQMLLYNGKPIQDAVYSAANGGRREESRYAFNTAGQGPKLPYLPGGEDRFMLNGKAIIPEEYGVSSGGKWQPSPEYHWENTVEMARIEQLWPEIGKLKSIEIVEKTPLGHGVTKLALTGSANPDSPLLITGTQFRQRLGATVVRSNYIKEIKILPESKKVKIVGGGYGHRAGLSQWGAAGLANLGVKYEAILGHYYPGTTLKKMVDDQKQTVTVNLKAGASQKEWLIRPSHTTQLVDGSGKKIHTLNGGQTYVITLPETKQPAPVAPSNRLSGQNRYETAVSISWQWEKADVVILARGDQFADALAGVPLAYRHKAPVLLTEPKRLPHVVQEELKRLKASKVLLLGGEEAIHAAVEEQLKQLGLNVERIKGANRFETAAEIARQVGARSGQAVLVNGLDFPDAFSVAAYAARHGYPIVLAEQDKLPEATSQVINALNIGRMFIIGGEVAIGDAVEQALAQELNIKVERIKGDNRYLTNLEVIKRLGGLNETAYVATGQHFADALTGSALAARKETGIVLTSANMPPQLESYLSTTSVKELWVLGGTQAVSDEVASRLQRLIKH